MAKNAKKSKRIQKAEPKKESPKFSLTHKTQSYLYLAAIAVLLLVILKPFVFDGLTAQGVDVVGSIGANNQIGEYQKESGERALWNPNIFAGMPIYHRLPAALYSVDTVISNLSRIINRIFIYYFFAAIGFYFMLRYLKQVPLVALLGTLLFILMPHYKSLYIEGHFAKFTAIMILPWIVYAFLYFLDKRTLLAAALFSLAFGMQIRTQHYQIVFYTALLIFAIGVTPFLQDLFSGKYQRFAKSTVWLIGAVVLAMTMSAQPLFLAKEYLPFSKRGKTTIDVHQQSGEAQQDKKADGVSMQYATQWSTHPKEMAVWLVPRFFGGMSNEKYDGSEVPQAKGQPVSGYWGYMPFTQSYEYMGIITLLLAIIGLIIFRKNRLISSMAVFAAFLILLSFGRHLPWFYSIFYDYIPFFNKFRAPMMSVTVTSFIVAVFAAFGLQYFLKLWEEKKQLTEHKVLIYSITGFFIFGLVLWIAGQTMDFIKPTGEQYQGQMLDIVKTIRMEYFNADMMRYFLFLVITMASIAAYLYKKINFTLLAVILIVVSATDLIQIQNRDTKKYINLQKLKKQYFVETATDIFLNADDELYRIFPAGKLFGDNRWAYYHQSIGGYTPIKMFTIEELVEKNIYNGPDRALPLNWNVLKLLDVKYVVLQMQVQHEKLSLVHSNPKNQLYTYRFNDHLGRGFFVDSIRVVEDEYERIREINKASFNPESLAILEQELDVEIFSPDSSYSKVTEFNPNHVQFEVYTDKQSLFVMSEVYYPPGWIVSIDDQESGPIYKTNHALQSVVVPAGSYTIDLRFEPPSYYWNIQIAGISAGIIYLIIIGSIIQYFIKGRKSTDA